MLFYLQAYYPHLSPGIIMGASMASGIMSSVVLETVVLRYWEGMALRPAFRTAVGMSMISMLVMEAMENVVDWHLTGGMIDFSSPAFWAAGAVAIGSGYLAALPYNYWRLKKYGKSCH
ncbi:hypothetical protein PhCBS80983_g04669 [Powellomyces hirtus]|uniref:DUF4396 domain-containing protein n=1 Tax=Powellomyces hirtus TaxID=109895 RepID=A0A507DYP2_9FUNG|nr:hypothetical protein PhCBS80983_g04669 [Powellomyces hirtus]